MNAQPPRAASHARSSHTAASPARTRARATAPIALALAGLFAATPTRAQMVVNDPPALVAHIQNIAKNVIEFGKQAERWSATANHYKQQLVKLQKLQISNSQMVDDFPERPSNYGMDDRCPGSSGGLDGLRGHFSPQMDGDIVKQQLALCQRAVLAENAKYNDSVRMLKLLIRRNNEFGNINTQRDSVGESQGALAANDNEAQRFMIRTQMDLDYWQARMRAYDDYILALQNDQSRLARRALEGRKDGSGIGRVIGTDSIKSAFSF